MPVTPPSLGLPDRFPSYRSYSGFDQLEAAIQVASSGTRFDLVSAPPGAGKSLLYLTVARLLSASRVLVLVGTKGLQQQLMADFSTVGMVDIRGQSNYRCIALDAELSNYGTPGAGCDEGPCHVGVYCPLRQDGGCLYYDAQSVAADSALVVSNYAYWITLGRHSDPLAIGEFDLLVLDEAHGAPDWLVDFCAVELDRREVKSILGLSLPPIDEGVPVWASWAKDAAARTRDLVVEAREELAAAPGERRRSITRRLFRLTSLSRDLSEMSRAHSWERSDPPKRNLRLPGLNTDWVAESTKKGARFSPVWAHSYAEPYLFRGTPRVLLTSATLTQDTGRYLGVPESESTFHEFRSGFSPQRRPFFFINGRPEIRVDHKMSEGGLRVLVNRIDNLLDSRKDRKGIIHTRSYRWAKQFARLTRHGDSIITHSPGAASAKDAIARFRKAAPPCVLVSPVVEEGVDFPGDQCRFQVIWKVPFVDQRGPIIRARTQADRGYPYHLAALALVQMYGRGMRSESDWCECVSPETRVLTDDLRWVPAGDVRRGDRLLSVDEHSPPGCGNSRRWRWATTEKAVTRIMNRVRLIAEDREIVCTPNHPWLVYGKTGSHQARMLVWRRTDELTEDDALIVGLDTWRDPDSWEKGWMAGFADGDGCLRLRQGSRNPNVLDVILAQVEGPTAEMAEEVLSNLGFRYNRRFPNKAKRHHQQPVHIHTQGGLAEQLRFLGSIRPQRLLDKYLSSGRNEVFRRHGTSRVVAIERLTPGPIRSLQTSTATYFAEGLVAHNTFLFDDHWRWFKKAAHFPRFFESAWRWVDSVPPPLDPDRLQGTPRRPARRKSI